MITYFHYLSCFYLEIAGGCPADGDGLFTSWFKHSLARLNAKAILLTFRNVPQEVNVLEGRRDQVYRF